MFVRIYLLTAKLGDQLLDAGGISALSHSVSVVFASATEMSFCNVSISKPTTVDLASAGGGPAGGRC